MDHMRKNAKKADVLSASINSTSVYCRYRYSIYQFTIPHSLYLFNGPSYVHI